MFYKLLFVLYFSVLFSFLLFINLYYLEGIPHVPDDAAYLFMAKMFATGNIIMPIPISPQHVDFFPGILSVENGTWLFQYPFGHPLLLSIGVLLGFPNIIPPLIGALFVFLIFLITKEVFNKTAAVFALFLPIISPFFLENAASFMSHNSAAFYLVLSIYCIILSLRKKRIFLLSFASGAFIGLLFNTRPLTTLPFLLIIILIVITKQRKKLLSTIGFLIGFFLLFFMWLLYNYMTVGNIFHSQYYFVNKDLFSFHQNQSFAYLLSARIENVKVLFNNFGPMLFHWPSIFTYGLLLIPLAIKGQKFWSIIFFLSLFSLPIAYFFYNGTFLMYGPRFWYEITPFVFILVGRSISILYQYKKKTTLAIFFSLIIMSFIKLFGIFPATDPDYFSLVSLPKLKGFNFTDARIINEVKRKNIHNAIIFVKDCNGNWWCYGSVFPQNSPTLDTDIIYLKNLDNYANQTVMKRFQGRSFYLADYNTYKIIRIN